MSWHDLPLWRQLALVALACVTACFGSATTSNVEQQARTSLNVLADVVDPAYQLAMRSCMTLQETIVVAAEQGTRPVDEADAELARVSARCRQVRDGFDAIRAYHDRARVYMNEGRFEEALQTVDKIREAWRELRQGDDDP